ncbi:MAG: NAD(P)/FAD-dependent oxidoreductase [Phycisphaerales bacterium]
MPERSSQFDTIIIGAGAAGLMTAITAGRSNPAKRILLLDGARKIGAKILVAGGGRCNVTHDVVDETAFAGSTPPAIRNVLRRFTVDNTVAFFREIGVHLKREDTGKLFPVTDKAVTVLNALLDAAKHAAVELRHPARVETVTRTDAGFEVTGEWGCVHAANLVLATGGKSLPKSGSDGAGYSFAQALGHSITPEIFPALVPLITLGNHFTRTLSGIAVNTTLEVRSTTGRKLKAFTNATLFTHFGLSGPGPLDISRYLTSARLDDPGAGLFINWLPEIQFATLDKQLIDARSSSRTIATLRKQHNLPERLANALANEASLDPHAALDRLSREQRQHLVRTITDMHIPVEGDRGYTYAEVTAGGVPLRELDLKSMQSRITPGLFIVGELCDVDGRIGGYNFQWAWSTGFIAGTSLGA